MLKAIETIYNGYRFRSRLEARWAVFFDTLGIKYEYEKEGYDLNGTWYLPDFHLLEQDCYIEIKGQEPTEKEKYKAELLAELAEKWVFLFYGNIDMFQQAIAFSPTSEFPVFNRGCWLECSCCDKLILGAFLETCTDDNILYHDCDYTTPEFIRFTPRLKEAYAAARQARFEHQRTRHLIVVDDRSLQG